MLALQCELYNAALEERRGAWRVAHRSVSYFDQCAELTTLDEVRPEVLAFGVTVCRGTLKRLDRAYAAFYRRGRAGQTPGFPRYRSRHRFASLQWEDRSGWKLKPEVNRLRVHGLGEVKVRLHRETKGISKAISIKREGRRWFLSVRCADVPAYPRPTTGREVGVDLGAVELVATSDGSLVHAPHFERRGADRLAVAQRELATKVRGSKRRERARKRVAAHHRAIRNRRHNFAHQLSRQLVNDYDVIVVEHLAISSLTRRSKPRPGVDGSFEPNGATAKSALNRTIQDAGWGELLSRLAYKAEDAGRELRVVDPKGTSQRCARCGHTDRRNRRTRAAFHCLACGHNAHADINAARNILGAGRAPRALARAGSN
jgi:putative transposase